MEHSPSSYNSDIIVHSRLLPVSGLPSIVIGQLSGEAV